MQFSRYTHVFDVGNEIIALYHSLLIRTVFLTVREKEAIDLYLKNNTPLDEEQKETVNYLFANYYIVDTIEKDDILYQQCIGLIYPSAISNAYIVVTENCNFNCKYCFISERVTSYGSNKVMSRDVAKASVELLQRTYERQQHEYDKTITFYGGEPLLNFDIIKYFMQEVRHVKSAAYWPSDVKFALITNGSLLTKENVAFLRQNNIALSISYDVDKYSHANRIDRMGVPTYDVVRKNIQLCIDEGMPYSLSITISDNTIGRL